MKICKMQDEYIQLKNKNELNYENLKSRHEKDLRIGLLGLNKNYTANPFPVMKTGVSL